MATRPPVPPPPSAPPPGGGMGEFLKTQIGPFPLWIWLIAGGGVVAFVVLPKILNKSSSNNPNASDPTATDAGTANAQLAAEGIDPLTGVPFSVEDAVNPNTGLPNYYNNYPTTTGTNNPTNNPVTNPTSPSLPVRPIPTPPPNFNKIHHKWPKPPTTSPFRTPSGSGTQNPMEMVPRSLDTPSYRYDLWR